MIPVGYMLKAVNKKPEWLKVPNVVDIYSVSGCVSRNFDGYTEIEKLNGYWLFDRPEIIIQLAKDKALSVSGMTFFYYEVYEKQYDEALKTWGTFQAEPRFLTNVEIPQEKNLEGYDVVAYGVETYAEHSPLSCNHLACNTSVNRHCLFSTFEDAKTSLESGKFDDSEPGPFRIIAVYSLPDFSINKLL